mgnify:CR=1 FL=1|jgi:CcmD family protein
MPDFLANNSVALYVSMLVALAVWVSIFLYLWRLDARVRELNKKLDQAPRASQAAPRATIETRNQSPEATVITHDK